MKSLKLLTAAFFLALVACAQSFTQTCPGGSGCLDVTFGNAGLASVANRFNDPPIGALVQSDGKIVVMPRGNSSGQNIARFNADGTLDTTFGNGGAESLLWKLVQGKSTYYGGSYGIALQTVSGSERILVVGQAPMLSGNKVITGRLRIDRLMPDGSYDTSWGTNGALQLNMGGANAVAVQPADQKIVIGSGSQMFRFNANGTLDTSFGSGGIANSVDSWDMTFDGSGRILVASLKSTGNGKQTSWHVTVTRFLSNGSLDSTFGVGGTATTPFAISYSYMTVRVDPYGNVVVGSNNNAANVDFAVARFDPNGAVDTTFNQTGVATVDFLGGTDIGHAATTQSDGKIVVVGSSATVAGSGSQYYLSIARFNYDGTLDAGFGTGGKVTFQPGSNTGTSFSNVITETDPACACEKILGIGATVSILLVARFIE